MFGQDFIYFAGSYREEKFENVKNSHNLKKCSLNIYFFYLFFFKLDKKNYIFGILSLGGTRYKILIKCKKKFNKNDKTRKLRNQKSQKNS